MANQEQVDLLQQGVKSWNTWRMAHTIITIDLFEADLNKADLSNADLSNADLRGARLNKADLSEANLRRAELSNSGLYQADLYQADLSNSDLRGADLRGADLRGADLRGANLSETDLSEADLSEADLSEANLSEANLSEANLSEANLSQADLSQANLSQANLSQANFTNAKIERTIFVDIDMCTIRGLETVTHRGPSTIDINTFVNSQGNIPAAFLERAGVPDRFITFARSLIHRPIEYYTCFISYSHIDEAFAKRLYADLQKQNVQCWFAPHDIRIGDEFRSRIDESIRIYDKLLLVLSRHSIESTWVKKEVETAFEKELRQGKLVLFPVKLDETVMQTEKAWAADIRRMRHIGDFRRWKDRDEYIQEFTRLLRDLKADDNI
jgi:uncharacterized protein YjbI with pentapeptide repeats